MYTDFMDYNVTADINTGKTDGGLQLLVAPRIVSCPCYLILIYKENCAITPTEFCISVQFVPVFHLMWRLAVGISKLYSTKLCPLIQLCN